jgi:multiple sugar transport system permease protein
MFKKNSSYKLTLNAFCHIILITGGITMILPFVWMLSTSFKDIHEANAFPPVWISRQLEVFIKNTFFSPRILLILFAVAVSVFIYKWAVRQKEEKVKDFEDDITFYKVFFSLLPKISIFAGIFIIISSFGWSNINELIKNYKIAWVAKNFGRYFFNSFYIAVSSTTLQLVISALASFAFAFMTFPLKEWIFMSLLATMMIPQQALLVPDYLILTHLGWINTYFALIVPWGASVFGIFLLRQFFLAIPRELYEAAKIDGCTKLGFFFKILLPLCIPGLTTLAVFTFIGSWNTFLWALIVTHTDKLRTIQVGLAAFNDSEGTRFELLMAASTFCVLPLIIGFFFAQKQFMEGISQTGMKG